MYKSHSVAVVMPVHNEAEHVGRAISRVPDFVDLIIAVDDGSTDGTWEELARINDERLVRLRHSENRGVGAATRTGYVYSLQTAADLIAVMDGDGQMDGRDLWRLLDCSISGADYVKGNRFLDRDSISSMPFTRFVGNAVFSWLTKRAASLDVPLDAQCGYTVIRRAALKRLELERLYDRYGFLNEMIFASRSAGLTIRSVPVRTVYGDEVSGINPLTAVPIITYLILRSFLRSKLVVESGPAIFAVRDSEAGSGE